MPDPNLPPLLLSKVSFDVNSSLRTILRYPQEYVEEIRRDMPELPEAKRARLLSMGLSRRDADVLMDVDSGHEVGFDGQLGPGPVAYYDKVSHGRDPKVVVNWCAHIGFRSRAVI